MPTGLHPRAGGTDDSVLRPNAPHPNRSRRRRVLAALCLVFAACSVAGILFVVGSRGPTYLDRLAWAASLDRSAPLPADFVSQRGDSDCGAAALKMVLAHHGFREVTLDEIEAAADVGPRGTSLLALKKIAEDQGLKSQGLRLAIEHLGDLPMPAIAHVHGDHFVVLRSVDAVRVVVDDPSLGRLRMSTAAFDRAWGGVVLAFDSDARGPVEPNQPSDDSTRVAA